MQEIVDVERPRLLDHAVDLDPSTAALERLRARRKIVCRCRIRRNCCRSSRTFRPSPAGRARSCRCAWPDTARRTDRDRAWSRRSASSVPGPMPAPATMAPSPIALTSARRSRNARSGVASLSRISHRPFRRQLPVVERDPDHQGNGAIRCGVARGDGSRLREAALAPARAPRLAGGMGAIAELIETRADAAAAEGRKASAGDYYLRAGNYFYNAERFQSCPARRSAPGKPRLSLLSCRHQATVPEHRVRRSALSGHHLAGAVHERRRGHRSGADRGHRQRHGQLPRR